VDQPRRREAKPWSPYSRTIEHTNDFGIANSSARVLPENTVCLRDGLCWGYVVVMGQPMATSQDFVNWVCSDRIDPDFLKYLFLAERTRTPSLR